MSGIKGQKWSEEKRRPKKIKCNLALEKMTAEKVLDIATAHDWSVAKTLSKIVTAGLDADLVK